MEIRQLLDGVANKEMVMPEFQREYVWSKDNAKQLLVSLYKSYPTGCLLFWETNDPPEIKNDAVARERVGLTKVILDGQQRLTTLYLIMKGAIPPYYTEDDLVNDPRNLYFNILTGDFQYYAKAKMEGNPLWQNVTDCFDSTKIDGYDIAERYCETNEEVGFKETMKVINNNLNQLRNIEKNDYPILTVPTSAKIDEAIDVFDRVNSRGTKLTDAELVLTHITGKWSQARRVMKEKKQQMGQVNFDFSLDFFTRCIVVSLTDSALYAKNAKLDYENFEKEDYVNAWEKASKALDYLIPIIKQDAFIGSSNDMNTLNVLVPMIAYLIKNENRYAENVKYGFIYWMFLALIWSRYSGQTDQRLDKDVFLSLNSDFPIQELVNEIEDQRGRIEVKSTDLEGRGASHPLYRMLYVITKKNKAIDWSNGGTVYDTIGDYYSIQSHHIFPQAHLYRNGYSSENHLDSKKVNEIANRAFITRDANYSISDSEPSVYLQEIEDKYPGALEKQLIPMDKSLWETGEYENFLQARRKNIAKDVNEFLEGLRKQSAREYTEHEKNYLEVIGKGENNFVEFKSSLRYCYREGKMMKYIEHIIAKTISAFLNSEGGTLFVGVSDDGEILGLKNDFDTFGKDNSKDAFLLRYDGIIRDYIGKEYVSYLQQELVGIDGKEIFVITVSPSSKPVFIRKEGKEEFYIRASASSQPMGMQEALEYSNMHWN